MTDQDKVQPLIKHLDYEIDSLGRFVLTRRYHLRRGFCCGNHCIHCPFDGIKGSREIKK